MVSRSTPPVAVSRRSGSSAQAVSAVSDSGCRSACDIVEHFVVTLVGPFGEAADGASGRFETSTRIFPADLVRDALGSSPYVSQNYRASSGSAGRRIPRPVRASRHAQLVVAVLRDVAHPRQRGVAALFQDLQVAHLDARHSEIGDLKLDLDAALAPLVGVLGVCRDK